MYHFEPQPPVSSLTRDLAEAQEFDARIKSLHRPVPAYKLYVGVVDTIGIVAYLADACIDATAYHARGSFNGQIEYATVIEIIGGLEFGEVLALARQLRMRYAESSVLVTVSDVSSWEVTD